MPKSKKIRVIFFVYWFLLLYIVAALVWWYIALNQQNDQMTSYKIEELNKADSQYQGKYAKIQDEHKRKTAQYAGEGSIFFLLILAGAILVYRMVNRELKFSHQQQQFLMAITHELKTPVAVAKLNLETLQLRKLDDAQQQRLIYNTLQETNRLDTLCNNILISSQIEAGGYRITNEAIDITKLVQDCVNNFEIRFPQRIFHFTNPPSLLVKGDMLLLQMAVNNLIDNAVKYSPKDSNITVDILENANNIEIHVKDEGLGIGQGEKKKIFKKFYRLGNEATRRSKGTGLGLYLSKRIVAAHDGRLYVKDNTPSGSIFVMELRRVA